MKTLETVKKTGYGHWRIETMHYNKLIGCTTTNSQAIDNLSGNDNLTPYKETARRNEAIKTLRNEIIRANKQY